jgi:hypothetical protein
MQNKRPLLVLALLTFAAVANAQTQASDLASSVKSLIDAGSVSQVWIYWGAKSESGKDFKILALPILILNASPTREVDVDLSKASYFVLDKSSKSLYLYMP